MSLPDNYLKHCASELEAFIRESGTKVYPMKCGPCQLQHRATKGIHADRWVPRAFGGHENCSVSSAYDDGDKLYVAFSLFPPVPDVRFVRMEYLEAREKLKGFANAIDVWLDARDAPKLRLQEREAEEKARLHEQSKQSKDYASW